MEVQVEQIDQLKRKMTVTVPVDEVNEEFEERFKELSKEVRVSGFRPGKVPLNLIKKQFGDTVKNEVTSELIRSTYPQALYEENLSPIDAGQINVIQQPSEKQSLQYEVQFEISPDIQLPDVSQFTFERYVPRVSDADVDESLEEIRQQQAERHEVERPAQENDFVTLDYEGTIGGEVIEDGKAENVTIQLGEHQLLPELEQALVGLKAGDHTTTEVQFPNDYDVTSLAGKKAQFSMQVHKVEAATLPELNDEFAQNLEGGNFEDLEELRSNIRQAIEQHLQQSAQQMMERQIIEKLESSIDFPLPETLVNKEIERLKQQQQSGQAQSTHADDEADLKAQAQRNVKLALIMNTYMQENNIQVDRQQVEQDVDTFVANFPDPEASKSAIYNRKNALGIFEQQVLQNQVYEDILSKAQVTEKPVSHEEFKKMIAQKEVS